MPDQTRDVTHYSRYFNIIVPSGLAQIFLLFILGMVAGTAILYSVSKISNDLFGLYSGVLYGIIIITAPALITALFLKSVRRRLLARRALFGVLFVTFFYSLVLVIFASILGAQHQAAYFLIFILANAAIYGYWFMIDKVVIDQRRGQIFTATVNPLLNVFFYIFAQEYFFSMAIPPGYIFVKLIAGMFVFVIIGYLILYIMDRPSKKQFNISGVALITAMINQWLYDVIKEKGDDLFKGAGVKRDLDVKILVLKGKRHRKAIFVLPDLHYGPFADIGGSMAPQYFGNGIVKDFSATPFIMHGAVNLEDNPISTKEIRELWKSMSDKISRIPSYRFKPAYGSISTGYDNPCRAINICISDTSILTLTKAPTITEDIAREIGIHLSAIAKRRFKNVFLIDAHNSRIESANMEELKGIYSGSKYTKKFENAIGESLSGQGKARRLRFGSASQITKNGKHDMGPGYTSVGIFEFGRRRFCMLYFDANNLLPSLREDLIQHIKEKFRLDAEIYTTDTHAVNIISLPASNVLGRETRAKELIPVIDSLINGALKEIEPVKYSYSSMIAKGFKVWGQGSEDALLKVTREIIRTGKRQVPLIITAGFIIAAIAIYLA